MSPLLKPEAMQRTLIVASKGQQGAVIETLHKLRVAHFIDYQESPGEFSEFKLGSPMPSGGPASERLVRVRAILRHLALEGAAPGAALSIPDIERRLDAQLDSIERDVNAAHEARESLTATLDEHRDLAAKLAPLSALPLKLEDYRGYDSLTVFVGRADPAFEAEVMAAAPDSLIVKGPSAESVFAVFATKAQARAASEALYKHGFQEVEVPAGTGTPEERLRALEAERAALESRSAQAKAQLERLATEQKDFLLAAEEHLTILVEKAEAPLSFASSENAFVVDAWVPASQTGPLGQALQAATDGSVHYEIIESGAAHAHAHQDHGSGLDAGHSGMKESHHVDKHEAPPTKYDNPAATRRYEWFTELFATPRYDEIDPTSLFAIFFPLFFGFMVGDVGLGIAIALIGYLLVKKLPRVDGMKQLGTAFVAAGLIAAIFGGVVFQDALGIPFGAPAQEIEHMFEEGLVASASSTTLTAKAVEELAAKGVAATAGSPMTCEQFGNLAGEWTWSCFLHGRDAAVSITHPVLAKTLDIPTILLLAVGVALFHLALGLILGIRNEWGHGAKHLGAKFGYLLLLLTFYPAAIALLNSEFWMRVTHQPVSTAYYIAGAGFAIGAGVLGWAEGAAGVLEIPTMFSNIFSYLRLGAVAVAKGAMAVAFNGLTLMVALTSHNPALKVLGIVGFVIAQVMLLVLGILSGGIQALRLNFVEMYTKFYKGGGKRFRPFGRERVSTATSTSAP